MAISIHPQIGTVLRCDYEPGFRAPEMIKRRPAVVISPRLRHRNDLCTVVPLSTTEPQRIMPYHCRIEIQPKLPAPYDAEIHWVKADMLATVAFHRLFFFFDGKNTQGKRKHVIPVLPSADVDMIRECVKHALGIT
jgi:uncharacterized protein YifN (PemK superfamily)